jgi:hypothetical protein
MLRGIRPTTLDKWLKKETPDDTELTVLETVTNSFMTRESRRRRRRRRTSRKSRRRRRKNRIQLGNFFEHTHPG